MEEFIQDWGYLALFLYSFGGGFLALAIAGAFSYAGDLNIYVCVVVAGLSNFIGSQFLFHLAKYNKAYVENTLQKHRRKVSLVKILLRKYGLFIIFIQKYIYGVKTLIPLVMGLSQYNAFKFMFLNLLASFLWAIVVAYISFTAGEILLNLADNMKYLGFITLAIVFTFLLFNFRKTTKKKINSSEV